MYKGMGDILYGPISISLNHEDIHPRFFLVSPFTTTLISIMTAAQIGQCNVILAGKRPWRSTRRTQMVAI
jgi:hypothetical protein